MSRFVSALVALYFLQLFVCYCLIIDGKTRLSCSTEHNAHILLLSAWKVSFCTVFARNRDTAVPAEGNGDLQTLICVLVARPRRCLTLSNPVP